MKNLIKEMRNFLNSQKKEQNFIWEKVSEIGIYEKIAGLFKIDPETLQKITQSIKENGYDTSQPIVKARIKNIGEYLVDGHTRLKAAIEAGEKEILVKIKNFDSLDDALSYTLKRQSERRNLSQSEILNAAMLLEKKKTRDGSGRSIEKLSQDLGVSSSTLQHAQKVSRNATEEDIQAIHNGEKTINEVFQEIKKQKNKKEEKDIENEKVSTHKKRKSEKQNSEINRTEEIVEIEEIESSLEENNNLKEKEQVNKKETKQVNETCQLKEKKESSTTINDKIFEEILRLLYKENLIQAVEVIVNNFGKYLSLEFKNEIEEIMEQKKNSKTNWCSKVTTIIFWPESRDFISGGSTRG